MTINICQGKSRNRACTSFILSQSPAVFSSEIFLFCCCLISSLLCIFLITSAVFLWALWIAPTPFFGLGIYCLSLFWVWLLLAYWIASILSKKPLYRFPYPYNVICFLAMTVLVHSSYGSCLFHLALFAYRLFMKFFQFWCIIFEMRGTEQIPMCMNHGVYSGVMMCCIYFSKKNTVKNLLEV